MFYVILVYALFASVFTISKQGLEHTQPFFLIGSRMMLAGLILLAFVTFIQKKPFKFTKSSLWKLFFLSLFNIYLANAFEFWGLKYLTSFKTCFIYSLSPFVSALLSYFVFSETLGWKKWGGLILAFFGFIPILLSHTSSEEAAGSLLFLSWAEISVMLAAICSVYGWILLRQLVKEEGFSPLMANGLSMLVGGFFALCNSFLVETWDPFPFDNGQAFLTSALALIVVSNLICYNLYGWLLKRYSATFLSLAGFTVPLFSALMGWYFLGEEITWHFYVSSVIVFFGLSLFNQEELHAEFFAKEQASSIISEPQ